MGELLAELDCAPREKLWRSMQQPASGDLMHSFVTRVIDWWGHTDQDQLPCSLMVLQLYPGHVIVHRPTSANTRIAPLDGISRCADTSDQGRGFGYCVLA
jgi:hypothetical protein